MRSKHTVRPSLEALENRWVPATIKLVGGNLFITNQTGLLMVQTTATPGKFEVTDAGKTVTISGVGGLVSITGTNKADVIQFRANASAFAGSLLINTGNDIDTITLQATAVGGIGGNVTILPGLGSDTTAVSAASRVGGSFRVSDPAGINSFINTSGLTVGADLSVAGVTPFVSFAALTVGGRLAVSSTSGASNLGLTFMGTTTIRRDLDIFSTASSTGVNLSGTMTVGGNVNLRLGQNSAVAAGSAVTVAGNLNYVGGEGTDSVTIASGFALGGNAYFALGGGVNVVDIAPTALVGGDLSITGGNDTNIITTLGNINGDVSVSVGNGSNGTIIGGTVAGMIRYRGGNGSEGLTVAPAVPATVLVDAVFGTGTATFSLISNATLIGRVVGTGGSYTFVQGGATLLGPLAFVNFP